jgi:ATP-dependent DNA helicase RecG
MEIHDITTEQVSLIRSIPEDHFHDRKSRRIRPASISKTVSAFANADGGELYVGVEDDGSWDGFHEPEAANGLIQTLDEMFSLGRGCAIAFLRHPDQAGLVLQIQVMKSPSVVNASDGTPRVRRGARSHAVTTPEELAVLERNKGIVSHETATVAVDPLLITNSTTIIEFILGVVPSAEPETWLRMQQVLREDLPTVAGILLYADLPQAVLPKSGIKLYRYRTSAEAGTRETLDFDPATIEGPLYHIIASAVERTRALVSSIQVLGPKGLESTSYPPETLHEVITNAVLHRDYAIEDDIHIRIFDNRVEVQSPGVLPGHVTVDNILDERFARNPSIVRLINKFPNPPNKDVGEGLRTAFNAMRLLRLKDPVIEQRHSSVLVTIRHERLASAEELVMEYLSSNSEISNSIARELTGITSENAMKEVFYRLRKSGMIQPIPGRERGPNAAWRVAEDGS